MIYSCILNGVMFKIVLNFSNIWLFYVLGVYVVREIYLKKIKYYFVYVFVVSLLGIKLYYIILMIFLLFIFIFFVNNDNCREILIMRKLFYFIFLRL